LDGIDPKRSSEVLSKFDPDLVPDIVYRMAHLKGVSEEVRQEIGDTFAAELRAMNVAQEEPGNADQKTIQVLKSMKPDASKSVLESLEAVDLEFARELKAKLFTFDDLTALDSRSMQRLLRELDSKQLAVAMKGASDGISNLVFSSMSSRAADMLRDDIDAMGPVRLADVEAAQKSIVDAAMRLEEEGVLTLPRGGDDVL
jgi:flagellar motor switch protein FliG